MIELANIVSALIGAILGGIVTWCVSRRLALLERCHTQIERTCEELQNYRAVYAQYYVEYLSQHAKAAGRDWANVVGQSPDMDKIELEHRVDASRGRLRVYGAILKRILGDEGTTAYDKIAIVLQQSAHTTQVDCRVIDRMCDDAMSD
jgi:hypothetical protein